MLFQTVIIVFMHVICSGFLYDIAGQRQDGYILPGQAYIDNV